MKKYCLTKCFKRNISALAEKIIDIVIVVVVITGLALAAVLGSSLVGIVVQLLALLANVWLFHISPVAIGTTLLIALSLLYISRGLLHTALKTIFKWLFRTTKNLTLNIVAPEQAECRIFEECK